MRDVQIDDFSPQYQTNYFGHVSCSPEGDAVGLVVMHFDNSQPTTSELLWETLNSDNLPTLSSRRFGLITEDLICDWHAEDGEHFDWADVHQTIAKLYGLMVSAVAIPHFFTFDKPFCKPDLISQLGMQGVSAYEGTLSETQVGMAYRNLVAMGRANRIQLTDHQRAQHQFRQAQYAIGKRVMVPEGGRKYLADARANCAHYTAEAAAQNYRPSAPQPPAGSQPPSEPELPEDTWQTFADGGSLRVRNADEAGRDILSLFGLPPSGWPPRRRP